jgi:hypothetical protein
MADQGQEIDDVIPPCPHCGKEELIYINARAYGITQMWFNVPYGEFDTLDNDGLMFHNSKTFRCGACDRIRRDVEYMEGREFGIRPKQKRRKRK